MTNTNTTVKDKLTIKGDYFYGNEISDYGKEHNRVDYRTLAKAFDGVDISIDLFNLLWDTKYGWDLYNDSDYNEENEYYEDVFRYIMISRVGAEILARWTDEIVWYNEDTNSYVWGITHCGTSWDYVLTDIEIEREDKR